MGDRKLKKKACGMIRIKQKTGVGLRRSFASVMLDGAPGSPIAHPAG